MKQDIDFEIKMIISVLENRNINTEKLLSSYKEDLLSKEQILDCLVSTLSDGLWYGNWFPIKE